MKHSPANITTQERTSMTWRENVGSDADKEKRTADEKRRADQQTKVGEITGKSRETRNTRPRDGIADAGRLDEIPPGRNEM